MTFQPWLHAIVVVVVVEVVVVEVVVVFEVRHFRPPARRCVCHTLINLLLFHTHLHHDQISGTASQCPC